MAEAVWTSVPTGKKQDDTLGGEKSSPLSPVSGSQPSVASKMSPPKDSYWFAQTAETVRKVRQVPKASPVEKDESPTQEQLSPSHKPYMDKQSDLHVEGVSPVERLYTPHRAATPNRLDSYWFAHSGIDLSSPTADQASDSGYSDGKESSPPSLQRERKSHQEQDQYLEGRQKQQKQLRTFTVQADALHEYESNHRQPKVEHYHDHLRYSANEEKRSYIWDTKPESKEAALKEGFDQKAKLEARRNAQRNHLSFAFANSTQDNLVEDRTNINGHPSYQGSEVIFPIIRNIDDGDGHGDKRTDTSSYNLIQKIGYSPKVHSDFQHCEKAKGKRKIYALSSNQTKECLTWSDNNSLSKSAKDNDCMSRSMIITSTTRGRKKTDLVPAVPLNRNTFSRMPSPAVRKEPSHSPARPRSSLSAAAEATPEKGQTPKVTMRSKPKSRPRPVSIAGTVPDQPPKTSTPVTKEAKPTKRLERKGPGTSAKPPATKAASSAAVSKVSSTTQKVPETPAVKEEEKEIKEVDQSVSPEPELELEPEPEPEPVHEHEPEPTETILPCEPEAPTEAESPAIPSETVPEPKKEDEMTTSITKSRITSEEEAKAALQEKRRLAREQAEREAELERIRQEEIRRQEEEQRRREEEEQRRQEEEQLRLMEELQRQEEEKLKKAIEEKQKREEEERLRQEEENRLKAEREEQERIAREEAERQRIELEERLKREEEERAERKRRVEQIMSRTRGKSSGTQQSDASSDKTQITSKPFETAAKLTASGHLPSSVLSALSSIHGGNLIKGKNENLSDNNNLVSKTPEKTEEIENNKQQSIVNNDSKTDTEYPQEIVSADALRSQGDNINNKTGDQGAPVVINNVKESERKLSCDNVGNIDVHHQTNGYSEDHEIEGRGNGSSHERSEATTYSTNVIKAVQPSADKETIDSNLEQVIQLEDNTTGKTTVSIDDRLLNKVEDVNSNTVPGTPIVAFEEVRQPQASITG